MRINASQLPNLITFSRIALVPVLILVLKDHDYSAALLVFLMAGLSDGLDGWVAKRWRYTTRLGAILDPVADKFLLVSSYVMLMLLGHLPFWLVLTVVFRDLLIVGGYLVYTSTVGPARMKPSRLSKANTFAQILLVIAVLAYEASGLHYPPLLDILIFIVFITTVASGMHYVWIWVCDAMPDRYVAGVNHERCNAEMSAQLALNLRLKDSASFANFYSARNAEAVDCLRRAVESLNAAKLAERVIYLWGPAGSGATHLLQAACHEAQALGIAFSYIPLREAMHLPPASLDDLESVPLVCLDDLHAIAGRRGWEQAVFALAERMRERNGLLIAAANAPPAQLNLHLPDLMTRLSWGPIFPLHALDDDEKLAALQLRAARLGLELPSEVARYVLARYPRDTNSLFEWLDRVDRQSLATQRRLTIPFMRELEKGT